MADLHRLFKTLVLEGAFVIGGAAAMGCDQGDTSPADAEGEGSGEAGEGDSDEGSASASTDEGDATGTPNDMASGDGDGDGDGEAGDGDGAETGASECPDTCEAINFGLSGEDDWALGCTPITTLCCWVTDACCDLCC